MKERNSLIHSLWPGEDQGWKHEARIVKKHIVVRPYSTASTDVAGVDDVVAVISHLVAVIRPLGDFVYTPID